MQHPRYQVVCSTTLSFPQFLLSIQAMQAVGYNIGTTWKKTCGAGREYLLVTLDDPSFPATVYTFQIEGKDSTNDLFLSRSKPNRYQPAARTMLSRSRP
ncbi:DUF736 family protein [Raoultella sp. WB_B2P2-3]|uniref:DUF736 family protein n=1 Tax=Raoultella scottii TaxID=3040937 RepID=A0ABU8Z0G1_9ENTR